MLTNETLELLFGWDIRFPETAITEPIKLGDVTWVATDADKQVWGYISKPRLLEENGIWGAQPVEDFKRNTAMLLLGQLRGSPHTDWKDSLINLEEIS